MPKQKIHPFLNNPPPFLEKYFIPTLIAKLEEVNPPFVNGGGVELFLDILEEF